MKDIYQPLIAEQWQNISALYNEHADKRPIMMLDVGDNQVLAFGYEQILTLLDEASKAGLSVQYERAVENREMVLFVRDTARKQLLSYTLKLE